MNYIGKLEPIATKKTVIGRVAILPNTPIYHASFI